MANRILFVCSVILTAAAGVFWTVNATAFVAGGTVLQKYIIPVVIVGWAVILIAERRRLLDNVLRSGTLSGLFLAFIPLLLIAVIGMGL
ncbi:MAG: hypothetical protein ACM3XM_11875 [Mycobacterium leprae]